MKKALEAIGLSVAADISTDQGQVDFSAAALKAKQANADASSSTSTRRNRRGRCAS